MFKFDKVVDQATGKEYMVTGAVFTGEKFDKAPDGLNWYEVDLCPDDESEDVPEPVDVVIFNNGRIQISQNIHGTRYLKRRDDPLNMNVCEAVTVTATLEGGALVIPAEEPTGRANTLHEVCEAAELKHLIDSKVYLIENQEGDDVEEAAIRITFKGTQDGKYQDLYIGENGTLLLSEPY